MEQLHSIINKYKSENLSSLENSPHDTIAFMVVGHMLYGNSRADVSYKFQ